MPVKQLMPVVAAYFTPAQIRYGYYGIGYAQNGLLLILGCVFAAVAIHHISVFLSKHKSKEPSVVGQVISAKTNKICMKVNVK
jgi:hypothetical protein